MRRKNPVAITGFVAECFSTLKEAILTSERDYCLCFLLDFKIEFDNKKSKINLKLFPSEMTTAASVAALRNSTKSFRFQGASSRLSLQKRSERKIEGQHDLEMLMLDGYGVNLCS